MTGIQLLIGALTVTLTILIGLFFYQLVVLAPLAEEPLYDPLSDRMAQQHPDLCFDVKVLDLMDACGITMQEAIDYVRQFENARGNSVYSIDDLDLGQLSNDEIKNLSELDETTKELYLKIVRDEPNPVIIISGDGAYNEMHRLIGSRKGMDMTGGDCMELRCFNPEKYDLVYMHSVTKKRFESLKLLFMTNYMHVRLPYNPVQHIKRPIVILALAQGVEINRGSDHFQFVQL